MTHPSAAPEATGDTAGASAERLLAAAVPGLVLGLDTYGPDGHGEPATGGVGPVSARVEALGRAVWMGAIAGELDGIVADPHGCGGVPAEALGELLGEVARVEARLAAVKVRCLVAAEEAGLPTVAGAMSTGAWLAQVCSLTGSVAARFTHMAATIDGHPQVLARLAAGDISVDHAHAVANALTAQQADADAREAAEAARVEQERRARERQAREAAERARTLAERERIQQAQAERERQIAAREAEQARQRAAQDEQAQQQRVEVLVDRAVQGRTPDQVRADATTLRAGDEAALERRAAAQHRRRSTRYWTDRGDGMRVVQHRLDDASYEAYRAWVDGHEWFEGPQVPAAERRSVEQRRCDAVMDAVHTALASDQVPTVNGQRAHVTVTMTADTLTRARQHLADSDGDEQADGPADRPRAGYGSVLSEETARRLACDATLTRLVTDAHGHVLDVGRETSRWTPAQRRAAAATFNGCAFPVADGQPCGRPMAWTDLHHVQYWRDGGRTALSNAVPLCRRHHTVVHHHGWQLTYDHDTLTVTVRHAQRDETRQVSFARQRQPG